MADWNAQLYETFKNERTLPARDLAAAVGQEPVTRALDVGCGTGTSTAVLRVRFPEATLFWGGPIGRHAAKSPLHLP